MPSMVAGLVGGGGIPRQLPLGLGRNLGAAEWRGHPGKRPLLVLSLGGVSAVPFTASGYGDGRVSKQTKGVSG
ncbi:hypothetical protein GUJ93_ZPchr0001g31689 [Zizania palustris]|uniref:Uncharacterized protein n=1 Tax=Zizania palustris TaxID=103762 RepID=A0A8J5RQY1_ZIZPA|nr:hypothetical protein GUJ93_ZPchr0001g31689 [Zizania palustris]